MLSAIKSWLPDWAQRIAGVVREPRHEVCRCAVCGGATYLEEGFKVDFGFDLVGKPSLIDFEKRRCVICGKVTEGVAS